MKNMQKGFTIVEMMMATLVFGLILLVIASAIIRFTQTYYKGVTETNLQNTARTIVDQISQGIQFAGGDVFTPGGYTGHGPYRFCIGNEGYTFVRGAKLNSSVINPTSDTNVFMYTENMPGCSSAAVTEPRNTGGRELLQQRMRISKISVAQLSGSSLYTINLRLVYGDDDLLCDKDTAGDCALRTLSPNLQKPNLTCKEVRSGSQFCAVSEITTTVSRRVR